jgi:hypothetical protein
MLHLSCFLIIMPKKKKKPYINESHCLNCDQVLHGKFCAQCGQKAFLHKENFFLLMYELGADYFHFDGKFFASLKALFLQPGKITKEYIDGKRRSYLNPIQMYIFVSAVFFILLSSLTNKFIGDEKADVPKFIENYKIDQAKRDSIFKFAKYKPSNMGISINDLGFKVNGKVYTLKQYDSMENALPEAERENFLISKWHKKLLAINEKTLDASTISSEKYPKILVSSLPKAFFFLLPLFALVLSILYRRYPYLDHFVFSLHFHIIGFVFMAFYFVLTSTSSWFDYEITIYAILSGILIYLFISIKKVYQNSMAWTITKFLTLTAVYGFFLFITMILLLMLSLLFL